MKRPTGEPETDGPMADHDWRSLPLCHVSCPFRGASGSAESISIITIPARHRFCLKILSVFLRRRIGKDRQGRTPKGSNEKALHVWVNKEGRTPNLFHTIRGSATLYRGSATQLLPYLRFRLRHLSISLAPLRIVFVQSINVCLLLVSLKVDL